MYSATCFILQVEKIDRVLRRKFCANIMFIKSIKWKFINYDIPLFFIAIFAHNKSIIP